MVSLLLVVLLQHLFRFLPATLFGNVISNSFLALGAVGLLVIAGRFLEHRSLSEIGLPQHHSVCHLLLGGLLGACLMSFIIAVMAFAGYYRITRVEQIHASSQFLLAFLFIFLAGAVQEEILFRGIIFRLAERAFGSWVAIFLSAIVFGLSHFSTPHAAVVSALAIAVTAGIAGAALFLITRSLWWSIGFHFGWNFFEGPIFGTQVSGWTTQTVFHGVVTGPRLWTGGSFGPEAGLIAIILVGSMGVLLLIAVARQGKIITPRWFHRNAQAPAGPDPLAPIRSSHPSARPRTFSLPNDGTGVPTDLGRGK